MRRYISYEVLRDRYVELPDVELKNKHEAAGYNKAISEILELMRTIPEVTAKDGVVMKGHWRRIEGSRSRNYTCSSCGTACAVPTCMGDPVYEYCPHCGAYMGV